MALTRAQHDLLLKPLQAERVSQRKHAGRQFSYLEAWDVRAHLNRIFGFGQWSDRLLSCKLLYCDKQEGSRNWDVSYEVTMSLHVKCTDSTHEDGAVGSAHLPDRGEALDMALKTAVSDSLKRCAVNWGTQFGMSLYKDGQLADVVRGSLVVPEDGNTEREAHVGELEVEAVPSITDETRPEADIPELDPTEPAVDVDITTGEIEQEPQKGPSAAAQAFLTALKPFAQEPDQAKRILGVGRLKADSGGVQGLSEQIALPNGDVVTLSRLADMVAQGIYVTQNGESNA